MSRASEPAVAAARRLWADGIGKGSAPDEIAAAAAAVCSQLRLGLERWIGIDGYNAILHRALNQAREKHPSLAGLTCTGESAEFTAAVQTHGGAQLAQALMAAVAELIGLLGRIVGDEMAVQLVAQAGTSGKRVRREAFETEGTHDA